MVGDTARDRSGPVFSCESITRYITNVNSPDDVLLLAH